MMFTVLRRALTMLLDRWAAALIIEIPRNGDMPEVWVIDRAVGGITWNPRRIS
jgi:hypothetical protein